MPDLFKTKYPNNSRVVSGAVTTYRDDVVLQCDTSGAPVTIDLFDIPTDFWSTQYKLYIVDNSNNASVNNITINAGGGQLLNGAASLVLNTNGAGVLIRILSNTNFLGTLTNIVGGGSVSSVTGLNTDNTDPANPIVQISVDGVTVTGSGTPADPLVSVGGGGGYDTIQDETVALPQRTTLDFVGNFVTATDDGAKTTVTVESVIIDILHADLLVLIGNSTLIKGAFYRVTDPPYFIDITLLAIETNVLQLEGKGRKYVADYQVNGDYTGIVGFNAQLGLWQGTLAPVSGDVCIWNNSHYLNISGANDPFTTPDADAVNWSLLTESVTSGYIIEPMTVLYNQYSNKIIKVKDGRKNEVDFADPKGVISLLGFPFGNNNVANNIFKGEDLSIDPNFCNVNWTVFKGNTILNSLMDFGSINFGAGYTTNLTVTDNYCGGGSQLEVVSSDLSGCTAINFTNNRLTGGNLGINSIPNTFTGTVQFEANIIAQGTIVNLFNPTGGNQVVVNGNSVTNLGSLNVNSIDTSVGDKAIRGNKIISGEVTVQGLTNTANFQYNTFTDGSVISIPSLADNLNNGSYDILTEQKSTFVKLLDLSDPTVYTLATFTLDLGADTFYGIYKLINGTGNQINKIINGTPTERPFTLIADSGAGVLAFRIGTVGIGVAVQDEIVANAAINTLTSFNGYATRNERVTMVRGGGVVGNIFVQTEEKWT